MGLYDVIKFDGVPNRKWIMYKYPGKEFFNNSTLIVGVGQIAISVHGGKVQKIFESGTYKLTTENLPFLRGLIKVVHGGEVPYTMEIYFFNTTVSLKHIWGTQAPIQMIDPQYNIKVRVRANGQYALRLEDYNKFFSLLMGNVGDKVLYEFDDVCNLFRGIINTKISVILGDYIIKKQISFLNISLYLEEISKLGKEKLANEFGEWGITLVNFFVASISVPEEDLTKLNEVLNRRAEFEIMGDERYRVARSFDVLEKAASNEGSAGNFAAAGLGLGIGLGGAPIVGQAFGNAIKPCICVNCNKEIALEAKFCPFCGTPKVRRCVKCNVEVNGTAAFCQNCGNKL